MSNAAELIKRARMGESKLLTNHRPTKKTKTPKVSVYGVSDSMKSFIENEMDEKLSTYIMRALKKQLKEDGFNK